MSNITQNWVNLVAAFTSDYAGKYTASSIAAATSTPQQTASRQLNALSEENSIQYEWNGRNKLFFINIQSETGQLVLTQGELHKTILFSKKHKDTWYVLEQLAKHCGTVIVFGSYASGKQTKDSDLDVALCEVTNRKAIEAIRKNSSIQIQEHITTYKKLAELLSQKNPLAIEIRNNHIIIGNVSTIITLFAEEACARR